MRTVLLLIVLISHGLAALPFFNNIRQGKVARTADFGVMSLILYYDLGLVFELLGYQYVSPYFSSLLTTDDGTFTLGILFLAAAPWLFHAGAAITGHGVPTPIQQVATGIRKSRATAFYVLAFAVTVPLALYSTRYILSGQPVWAIRQIVGLQLGPLVVLMYMPLYFLAFYVRQSDARTKLGLVVTGLLAILCVVTTLPLGERWMVLMPFLIIALFRFRMSLAKIVLVGITALVTVTLLLGIFKAQFAGDYASTDQRIANTVSADISRAGVLESAIQESSAIGTRVMPYPMAGYIYTALAYIPRSIVPFKGYSTSIYFTSAKVGTPVEELNWDFGIGYFEDIMLNAGLLLVIPGLFVYGLVMGLLDRLSWRVPSTVVATRLSVVWLGGYTLASIFIIFGTMAVVAIVLHRLFIAQPVPRGSETQARAGGIDQMQTDASGVM